MRQDIQCSYYNSISYLKKETNGFQYFPGDIYIVLSIALILTRLLFLHSGIVILFSLYSNIYTLLRQNSHVYAYDIRFSHLEHVVDAL